MIDHMIKVTDANYANDGGGKYWIYHDALSQITDSECVKYIESKNLLHRFIKPELGCNSGTIYANRLVGNSPEFNPLDCSLFADLTYILTLHLCLTHAMDDGDIRKFTYTCPDKIEHAVDRLWSTNILPSCLHEGQPSPPPQQFPSSDRILTDIKKIPISMMLIIEAKGTMLLGIGNRSGKRATLSINQNDPNYVETRGGSRTAGVSKFEHLNGSTFFHPDVEGLSDQIFIEACLKFEREINSSIVDIADDKFKMNVPFVRKSTTSGALRVSFLEHNRSQKAKRPAATQAGPNNTAAGSNKTEECYICHKSYQRLNRHLRDVHKIDTGNKKPMNEPSNGNQETNLEVQIDDDGNVSDEVAETGF
jgi:hypothetical protein